MNSFSKAVISFTSEVSTASTGVSGEDREERIELSISGSNRQMALIKYIQNLCGLLSSSSSDIQPTGVESCILAVHSLKRVVLP